MIENWVNWEIWARGALCSRGGWLGSAAGRGRGAMHVYGTLTRLARHVGRRSWIRYELQTGRSNSGSLVGPEERAALPLLLAGMRERAPRGGAGRPCLPAAELEEVELEELRGLLRASGMLGDVVTRAVDLDRTLDEAQVTVTMTRLDQIWDQFFPAEQIRIVH